MREDRAERDGSVRLRSLSRYPAGLRSANACSSYRTIEAISLRSIRLIRLFGPPSPARGEGAKLPSHSRFTAATSIGSDGGVGAPREFISPYWIAPMSDWLRSALEYITAWIDFQRELFDQPGVSLAVARNGEVVLEHASGSADLATGEPLTPRHRFRVASHSKTFTAAGVMLLHEREKIRLDDRLGAYVAGLTPEVSKVTLAQLLSHAAGLTRDGADGGQFTDRGPFLSEAEIRADLAAPQPLAPGATFKY